MQIVYSVLYRVQIVYSVLLYVDCLQCTAVCRLFTVYYRVQIVYSVLLYVDCLLYTSTCRLFTVYFRIQIVYSILPYVELSIKKLERDLCFLRSEFNGFYVRSLSRGCKYFMIDGKGRTRDKRVTEIDVQLKYAIFSTTCSIVYNFTVHNQSANIYIQGYLKILWMQNKKIFKNSKKDCIHKCYDSYLKLEYFFKSCKP